MASRTGTSRLTLRTRVGEAKSISNRTHRTPSSETAARSRRVANKGQGGGGGAARRRRRRPGPRRSRWRGTEPQDLNLACVLYTPLEEKNATRSNIQLAARTSWPDPAPRVLHQKPYAPSARSRPSMYQRARGATASDRSRQQMLLPAPRPHAETVYVQATWASREGSSPAPVRGHRLAAGDRTAPSSTRALATLLPALCEGSHEGGEHLGLRDGGARVQGGAQPRSVPKRRPARRGAGGRTTR